MIQKKKKLMPMLAMNFRLWLLSLALSHIVDIFKHIYVTKPTSSPTQIIKTLPVVTIIVCSNILL